MTFVLVKLTPEQLLLRRDISIVAVFKDCRAEGSYWNCRSLPLSNCVIWASCFMTRPVLLALNHHLENENEDNSAQLQGV